MDLSINENDCSYNEMKGEKEACEGQEPTKFVDSPCPRSGDYETPKRKRVLTHDYYLRSLKDLMSPYSPNENQIRRIRMRQQESKTPSTMDYNLKQDFPVKSKSAVLTSLSLNRASDRETRHFTPLITRQVEMSPMLKNSSFFRRKTFDIEASLSNQKLNYQPYKGKINPL